MARPQYMPPQFPWGCWIFIRARYCMWCAPPSSWIFIKFTLLRSRAPRASPGAATNARIVLFSQVRPAQDPRWKNSNLNDLLLNKEEDGDLLHNLPLVSSPLPRVMMLQDVHMATLCVACLWPIISLARPGLEELLNCRNIHFTTISAHLRPKLFQNVWPWQDLNLHLMPDGTRTRNIQIRGLMHYPLCDELLYQLSYMAGGRSLAEESTTHTTLQHAVEMFLSVKHTHIHLCGQGWHHQRT